LGDHLINLNDKERESNHGSMKFNAKHEKRNTEDNPKECSTDGKNMTGLVDSTAHHNQASPDLVRVTKVFLDCRKRLCESNSLV
jgi:hypothetical protein